MGERHRKVGQSEMKRENREGERERECPSNGYREREREGSGERREGGTCP